MFVNGENLSKSVIKIIQTEFELFDEVRKMENDLQLLRI
jgi:hypothetical protein